MNYFNKINKVPSFEDILCESIDIYKYKLVSDDKLYPEYKFVVPESENNKKYVYTVNLDSGFRGNRNDYEVTFYFGKDNGVDDIYGKTNNLGIQHLYSVLATLDAILLDAAERYPVRDFIVSGESTQSEKGDGKVGEQNVRTKMYMRYARNHYPEDCCSLEEDTGIMRIHAYELPKSKYAATMMDESIEFREGEGIILSEGHIPYNDYSDFKKISLPGCEYEFNVEVKLNEEELDIQINPLPRELRAFSEASVAEDLFQEVKLMLVNMSASLDGGGAYKITRIKIRSSAIPAGSVDPEVGKVNRLIEHMCDSILLRGTVTYTPNYDGGVFCAKVDTTIANLS